MTRKSDRELARRSTVFFSLCCARILLSVLRTLLHGAFPWLQPRSPVVRKVVERGRGPDPPDASVEALESGRAESAQAARASLAEESHRAGNLLLRRKSEGTQIFVAEVFGPEEQRTEASSPPVAVSRGSREARGQRRSAANSRSC